MLVFCPNGQQFFKIRSMCSAWNQEPYNMSAYLAKSNHVWKTEDRSWKVYTWSKPYLWRGTFLVGTLLEHSFLLILILIRNMSISFQIIPCHSKSFFIQYFSTNVLFLTMSKDHFKICCYSLDCLNMC